MQIIVQINANKSLRIPDKRFHPAHALHHRPGLCMAIGLVGKSWVGMAQNPRQGHDVRAGLHPVGGEGVPQGMHAAAWKLCFVQQAMEYSAQIVPVGGIAQLVGKDVALAVPSFCRRMSPSAAFRRRRLPLVVSAVEGLTVRR